MVTPPTRWTHLVIRAGAEARFHKTSRILADHAGGHVDRTFDERLAAHAKADLLILDFAMREFTPGQADDHCSTGSSTPATRSS